MKTKSLFAIFITLTLFISTLVIPVNAETTPTNNDIEIIIISEVSDETKAKIERHFITSEPGTNVDVSTYGLTCTLFGHKLESSIVATVTHKVNSAAPRCLKRTYNYEACTRCDYDTSTLIKTEYIYCCA